MAFLPEETRDVRGDDVQEMDDLLAGRIGQKLVEIGVVVLQPEQPYPLAHARADEPFLALAERDAAEPVNEGAEFREGRPGHASLRSGHGRVDPVHVRLPAAARRSSRPFTSRIRPTWPSG